MASSCSSLFHPAHLTGPCRQSPFTTTTARSSISLERQNSSLTRSRLFFPTPSTSGQQIQATLSNRRLSFTPSAAIHGELSADVRLGAWMVAADIDPATAKLAIGVLGPFLPAFAFLFIVRIVMSWYPKLPVGKFPYVVAYAPTEPILAVTRKVIPPLAGVDVTPVVWFGLVSFLNEILVGPQGLLVLISQQVN